MRAAGKTIAILVFEGVQPLDVAAPLDAFSTVNALKPGAYLPTIAGLDTAPITSETGLRILPTVRLDSLRNIDTLIIPGGAGLRKDGAAEAIAAAILGAEHQVRRLVSVCTGIYGLAPTGLLDGLERQDMPKGPMNTAAQMLCASVSLTIIAVLHGERFPAHPETGATAALAYLVVFGSIIAFSAYLYVLKTVRPALATSYAYVNPPVAVLFGVALAGEHVGPFDLAGMAIILVGVGIITMMRVRKA